LQVVSGLVPNPSDLEFNGRPQRNPASTEEEEDDHR
jgi:hypothetical protein